MRDAQRADEKPSRERRNFRKMKKSARHPQIGTRKQRGGRNLCVLTAMHEKDVPIKGPYGLMSILMKDRRKLLLRCITAPCFLKKHLIHRSDRHCMGVPMLSKHDIIELYATIELLFTNKESETCFYSTVLSDPKRHFQRQIEDRLRFIKIVLYVITLGSTWVKMKGGCIGHCTANTYETGHRWC